MADKQPLPELYHDDVARSIDENGIGMPHGFVVDQSDALTMIALHVPPALAYSFMLKQWSAGPKELIFALDRFAREGQGTTLGDVMAGHYFVQGQIPRPFIIEYQHEPRIVQPIVWDNAFWNAALMQELAGHLGLI